MDETTLLGVDKDTVVYLSGILWIFMAIFISIYRHIEEMKIYRNRHMDYDDIDMEFHNSELKIS